MGAENCGYANFEFLAAVLLKIEAVEILLRLWIFVELE